jgi:hypothetical protein
LHTAHVPQAFGNVESPAVAAEAERAIPPGQDIADGLPTWERELGADSLDLECDLAERGNSA